MRINIAYIGAVLPTVSSMHWGSWNISPTNKGGLLYFNCAFSPIYHFKQPILNWQSLSENNSSIIHDVGAGRSRGNIGGDAQFMTQEGASR